MKCFRPRQGYKITPITKGDKPYIVWKDKISAKLPAKPIEVRCGNCIGCRLTRARDWAIRINHEASFHRENSFITLTYDNAHLPTNASLDFQDWTTFMKALRHQVDKKYGKKIRFYAAGEYGTDRTQHENIGRPHFHAIIFGHGFHEKKITRTGSPAYNSPELDEIWGKGRTEVGTVTMESAGYVAGYVTKKINGNKADDYYRRINQHTGETASIEPEGARMSRMPGIGKGWYEKYQSEFEKGFVIMNGKKTSIPQFYKRVLQAKNPELVDRLQAEAEPKIKKQDRWNLEAEENQVEAGQAIRNAL